MIDLYSWTTPNGRKVHIMLEELGLAYTAHPIDIGAGDQFDPAFVAISPNNKIPAIVDHNGLGGHEYSLFESGAILLYLAEKTGCLMPSEPRAKFEVYQWLMFQMGNVGPMLGQAHHFNRAASETIDYAVARYEKEANRLYSVMDKRLGVSDYLAGEQYTIADIAVWPWLQAPEFQGVDIEAYPNVKCWSDAIGKRDAVQAGVNVLIGSKSNQ
ncbi:glutathione S-transferase family protein [Salinisphaera sp. USBA-960]|uniref:glutathione S-transferase N-terminal domain-containing protein n=1 Tax=Salinisphaera orenii TaxID=856731 RepID=UPI000DBE6D51|nr:glutathione S-transferase family protein [Salifodinibacter halophilus]NNC26162.1 glutathione S-transferase family protein [Salifodinibacter halophilus]